MEPLTIGRAAREAGVGVETIRFYERRGLIDRPPKPQGAGYRLYPPEIVERIQFIREAQTLGFSLREIQELLSLRSDSSADCGAVRARARAKVQQVNGKIAELERIRVALERIIAVCPGRGGLRSCTILEALAAVRRPRARRSNVQHGTEIHG